MALHYCFTGDGMTIGCLCVRGVDHDEALFDIPVGQESGEDESAGEDD